MVELGTVPIIPTRVIWEEEANGGALLYNMDTDDMVSLNQVGTTIWRLCNGKRSVDEIIHQLLKRYKVPATTCRQETIALLDQLSTQGLLEWTEATSTEG